MKQIPLVQVGHDGFRDTCTKLTDAEIKSSAFLQIIRQTIYTLRKIHGVGLAAPQVGRQVQFFVIRQEPTKFRPELVRIRPYVVINPEILAYSKKVAADWEGCFSVAEAGLFAKVERPIYIKVRYQNLRAELVERTIKDFEARVFLHEYGHLHGKVFLDETVDLSTIMSTREYRAMQARTTSH